MLNKITIPPQLQNPKFRFCLLKTKSKVPFEKNWANNGYKFNDSKLISWITAGGNYGVIGGYGDLVILDKDTDELPIDLKTFCVRTGSGGMHFYIITDYKNNHVFINGMGEVRAKNYQAVAPGCIHPNGKKYIIEKDLPIATIEREVFQELIRDYIRTRVGDSSLDETLIEATTKSISGKDGSRSGKEYGIMMNLIKKDLSKETIFIEMEMYSKWASSPQQYKEITYNKALQEIINEKKEKKEKTQKALLTVRGQLENFWEEQPFYYDKSKIFWLWDGEYKKWRMSDEVDFLNSIQKQLGLETLDMKLKNQLIEGFKQIGRKHTPKPIKKHWVQFKDKIYDIIHDKVFVATPEYFVKNPIPWEVSGNIETPTIDKLFGEWVGEDKKVCLYEFIAYAICPDKFMQRIFAFCGGGANGKGTYIKLCYKFFGDDNCVASELKSLSEDKFEPAILFGKLLCVMGEVSHSDLNNTNQIKKISGEDKLSFQFKGKTPFTDENTATGVCLTNSLPRTPDKSIGFYRKWFILDFPNQFSGIKYDIINSIPDEEFNNLATRALQVLKKLYSKRKFSFEGDFDERVLKYEERSNPVMKFLEEFYEESSGGYLPLREFTNECNTYLKKHHLRVLTAIQIGKVLREEGFSVGQRKIDDISSTVILNLKTKIREDKASGTTRTTRTIQKQTRSLYEASDSTLDGSASSNGFVTNEQVESEQ